MLLLGALFGRDGFLGTRGSLMMDIVFSAMLIVVPVMGNSIWLARSKRAYTFHKQLQLALAAALLVAIVLFELEMRLVGWQHRAAASRFWKDGGWNDAIDYSLAVHLLFAIPTPILWAFVIFMALRRFSAPPRPGAHSASHVRWARRAAIGMACTSVTGWLFYCLAFIA